jgi:integrase
MLALDSIPPRLGTALLFPAPLGGHLDLDNWRTCEWYPALDAAGVKRRGPYHLRHTFATEALAAGVSIFELARLLGASVKVIDRNVWAPCARLGGPSARSSGRAFAA